MKTIQLHLNENDLEGFYLDVRDCPIARALNRTFPNATFCVGGKDISVNGTGLFDIVDFESIEEKIDRKIPFTVILTYKDIEASLT